MPNNYPFLKICFFLVKRLAYVNNPYHFGLLIKPATPEVNAKHTTHSATEDMGFATYASLDILIACSREVYLQ